MKVSAAERLGASMVNGEEMTVLAAECCRGSKGRMVDG